MSFHIGHLLIAIVVLRCGEIGRHQASWASAILYSSVDNTVKIERLDTQISSSMILHAIWKLTSPGTRGCLSRSLLARCVPTSAGWNISWTVDRPLRRGSTEFSRSAKRVKRPAAGTFRQSGQLKHLSRAPTCEIHGSYHERQRSWPLAAGLGR